MGRMRPRQGLRNSPHRGDGFMAWSKTSSRRVARRAAAPVCEAMESRTVMSTFVAPFGTISGSVINEFTGQGVPHVQIQLINSTGRVVGRTATNFAGLYLFNVKDANAYVVRELTPRHFLQLTPS